jgi:threonine dehydratase
MKPEGKRTGWGGDPVPQPSLSEIQTAAEKLKDVIVRTPLVPLHSYDSRTDIYLKPEILQPIGSYKIRGVFNWATSLSAEERKQGLSTVSAGNTAMAVGYTASLLGVKARSILPDSVPDSRVAEIENYGVDTVNLPIDELLEYMFESHWKREQYSYLNPWGELKMIVGSGTIGLEIFNEMPNFDTVYVPVGGGGLISGVGSALKSLNPSVKIVGVQSETCPSLQTSLSSGCPTWVDMQSSICHGTAVPLVVDEMFPLLSHIVDDTALVSEDDVKATIKRLALRDKLIVEGSGALPVAAALATPPEKRGKSVCIISGGSIDPAELKDILVMKL